MDLGEHLKSAKESLFRFEYLQEFDVPKEREFFKTGQIYGQAEIENLMHDWWNFLDTRRKEGVLTQRVRLVRLPLTKYLEWELYVHRQTVERHKDDIRTLSEENLRPDIEKLGDFWLVDDSVALKMNYDSDGKYLGFEEVAPQPYIDAKRSLLENSTSI